MVNYRDFLGCKYPIVCVSMNQVSDAKLALAVKKAGAMPSLFFDNEKSLRNELETFNDPNVILTVCCDDLLIAIPIIIEYKITHVELLDSYKNLDPSLIISLVKYLKNRNVKILFKQPKHKNYLMPYLDAVVIKGNEGAGNIVHHSESIENIINQYKNTPVIATGGVATNKKIIDLLNMNVMAIGIGTLFAVSQESKISQNTKLKMISDKSSTLEKPNNSWKRYMHIGKFHSNDDNNMTNNLLSAVDGKEGIIYIGEGIKNVNSILTVEQIVQRLMAPAQGIEP